MTLAQYSISASWNARAETPEELAVRFLRLVERLDGLHPAFANWIWCGNEPIPFRRVRDRLAEAIAACVVCNDDGSPEPRDGYRAGLLNELIDVPQLLHVSAKGGSVSMSPGCNYACIETGWRLEPDPTLVVFDVIRPAFLALAETYEVKECAAYPVDIIPLWKYRESYRAAWMSYVKPAWAPLITPPTAAFVEYRPNGALFMAATVDTFRTQNPQHVAVANDIVAALAPLKAMSGG